VSTCLALYAWTRSIAVNSAEVGGHCLLNRHSARQIRIVYLVWAGSDEYLQ
jgi:hypothetical protein